MWGVTTMLAIIGFETIGDSFSWIVIMGTFMQTHRYHGFLYTIPI